RPWLVPVGADRARGRGRGSLGRVVRQRLRAARRVRDRQPGHRGAVPDPEPGVLPRLQGRQVRGGGWSVATTGPTNVVIARFTVESANQGGPDDNSYRSTHPVLAGVGLLSVLHLWRDAVYDPSACGRVASTDASYWLQNWGEPRQAQAVSFA